MEHTGFQQINYIDIVTRKKNWQVLWSVVFKHWDQFLTFFRLKTYTRVQYTYSPVVLVFWLCTGSGKRIDGNNLWLSFKSWRLLFLFSCFPLVPKMSFGPGFPYVKWNCCQHFITFSISGFLRANSSSKDSHALLHIFQSSVFFPSVEGYWARP